MRVREVEAELLVLAIVLGVIDDGDEVGTGDEEDVEGLTCSKLVDDKEALLVGSTGGTERVYNAVDCGTDSGQADALMSSATWRPFLCFTAEGPLFEQPAGFAGGVHPFQNAGMVASGNNCVRG